MIEAITDAAASSTEPDVQRAREAVPTRRAASRPASSHPKLGRKSDGRLFFRPIPPRDWTAGTECWEKGKVTGLMFGRVLNRFFRVATSRETFLFVGLALAFITGSMLIEQVRFVLAYSPAPEAHKEAEGIVDGLAGVLVAAGVFLESRDTLRRMACGADEMANTVDARLNEVATQNGMGVLIVGLLMEIGTLLIGLPPRVLDTRGIERGIYVACVALSAITLVILYDFLKDYALTYRMKREPLPPAASRSPH